MDVVLLELMQIKDQEMVGISFYESVFPGILYDFFCVFNIALDRLHQFISLFRIPCVCNMQKAILQS